MSSAQEEIYVSRSVLFPTREAITEAIKTTVQHAGINDAFLFCFSGHGIATDDEACSSGAAAPKRANFAGARGLAGHSLRRRGQSALMRPEPIFGSTEPRKLCVQGSNGFGRGLGVHRMRQRCRLRR
jgi:hypothetical protein